MNTRFRQMWGQMESGLRADGFSNDAIRQEFNARAREWSDAARYSGQAFNPGPAPGRTSFAARAFGGGGVTPPDFPTPFSSGPSASGRRTSPS